MMEKKGNAEIQIELSEEVALWEHMLIWRLLLTLPLSLYLILLGWFLVYKSQGTESDYIDS